VDPFLIILFVALLGFMYFSSRKARRQQQERAQFQSELAPGQLVITTAGLVGTVVHVEGDVVTLEHAPGSVTTWVRSVIVRPYEPIVEEPEESAEVTEDVVTDDDGPSTPGLIDKP
jgi:preprotein translocase subunit YajC